MDRDAVLRMIAGREYITIQEGMLLITEYIFDVKNVRVVITDISNQDLLEKAVTVATNYFLYKTQ